jgi:integrase
MKEQSSGQADASAVAGSHASAKGCETTFAAGGAGGALYTVQRLGLSLPWSHDGYIMAVSENARSGGLCPQQVQLLFRAIADPNYMGNYGLGLAGSCAEFLAKSENSLAGGPAAEGGSSGLPPLADFAAACLLTGSARHARGISAVVRDFIDRQQIHGPPDVTAEAVERHLAGLLADGQSTKTVINARSAISRWCKWLGKKRLPQGNPALEVELAPAEELAPVVLDDPRRLAEIVRLAARQCGAAGYGCVIADAIIIAVFAGLRLSELCRMEWADVDLAGQTLIVRKAKGKKGRVVSLARHARTALARQRRRTEGSRWVFPGRTTHRGGWTWKDRPASPTALLDRLKPVQRAFPEFRRLEGKRIGRGWHLFRHTFATELCEADVSLKKTADWMGHVDIRMTARYVHLRRTYDPDIERIMHRRTGT